MVVAGAFTMWRGRWRSQYLIFQRGIEFKHAFRVMVPKQFAEAFLAASGKLPLWLPAIMGFLGVLGLGFWVSWACSGHFIVSI